MVTEQMAYEHRADLRRAAAATRTGAGSSRIASRKGTAKPSLACRLSVSLHLRPSTAGCQA